MKDLGLLLLRVVSGGLLAGHGAQKLFGWSGGPGLEGTAQWLESMGLEPGGDNGTYFQSWTEMGGPDGEVTLRNVIGKLPGRKPGWEDQTAVVSAHYDHLGFGWPDVRQAERGKLHPGADDNASGVAVLLEVAEVLAQQLVPDRTILFVAFSGEEWGLKGSRHFVQIMGAYRPRAMILLDMVGDADLRIPMEEYSRTEAPALTDLVFSVAESLQAPGFVREDGPAVFDDHVPFLARGIPAVDLIDFDYPAWHTVADLPDRCSPASLESVARVVLNTLHRMGRESAP